MKTQMRVSTAGLVKGQRVYVVEQMGGLLLVEDSLGCEHLILAGDVKSAF